VLWGYEGTYPGPTIEAGAGELAVVNWINDLRDDEGEFLTRHELPVDLCPHGASDDAKHVTHVHGAHTPPEFDGYPEDTFLPGEQDTYLYLNEQLPATLWYHDHSLGQTRLNVYLGEAGFFIIRDEFENSLGLPSGEFEVPMLFQDRSFNQDGSLQYPGVWEGMFHGDYNLVNGMVWPYFEVKRAKYRFRWLNGANSRTYTRSRRRRRASAATSSSSSTSTTARGSSGSSTGCTGRTSPSGSRRDRPRSGGSSTPAA
jgi:spore coat protein A